MPLHNTDIFSLSLVSVVFGYEKKKMYICSPFKKIRNMTKADIVNAIHESTGIEKTEIKTVVDAFIDSVKDSLSKGNPVYLRGFGSFIIKHRAAKTAQNITKKTTMVIPEHDIPAFKPSDDFIELVSEK